MSRALSRNLDRLLAPRQIAFVGGTDAAVAIGEARRRGFGGEYWAVNPNRDDIAGVPCVATVDDLPGPPDAVFLAIPASAAVEAVARLAAMGTGGVVCYSAGFKETGPEGAALEDALRAAAGDMALVGPNCYGVINYVRGAALWPFAHGGGCPGWGAAIVTQSGMLSSDITMSQRSLPLAYMVSAGNQAVLGLADYVACFATKPEVRAIGLHIEGLTDVPAFERAALTALACAKPVVALKTGTSATGAALTVSHSGNLSGERELYEALFRRCGVIPVASPAQLLETLKYLCVAGAPGGTRVAGFTASGGGATMLADHAETVGLTFPGFDADSRDGLRALLPPIATVSNPLDYTTPIWGQPQKTGPVFARAMARSDIDAAILVQDYPASGLDESHPLYAADAAAFAGAAQARGIPAAVCSTLPENLDARIREALIAQGVAPMQGLHEALNAIRDAARWMEERRRILADPPPPLNTAPLPTVSAHDEAEAKAWVRTLGLAVPEGAVASDAEAPATAAQLGFPVALKMLSATIHHKTEAGTVALPLADERAVADAVAAMRARLAPALFTGRFLVERMEPPPVVELILGIRRDAEFGLALTLGSGGVLAELVGDVETVLLPATAGEVCDALDRLRAARLMRGYRGGPTADLDAIAAAIYGFAVRVLANGDTLGEIEINPLFVHAGHAVAVDALLRAAPAFALQQPAS